MEKIITKIRAIIMILFGSQYIAISYSKKKGRVSIANRSNHEIFNKKFIPAIAITAASIEVCVQLDQEKEESENAVKEAKKIINTHK